MLPVVPLVAMLCCALFLPRVLFAFNRIRSKMRLEAADRTVLGFFHPFCDSGGGGERVLWMMIAALLRSDVIANSITIVIYCGDTEKSREEILKNVMTKFRINIPEKQQCNIVFCKIYSRKYLDGSLYPFLTMLFQSVASLFVNVECLVRLCPDVYIDTMGVPYAYPLAKYVAGCRVIAYIHYPIISSDMLKRVRQQRPSFNNNSRISGSVTVSSVKLWYYKAMSALFSLSGHCVDIAFVNSSWTEGHMRHMWHSSVASRRKALREKDTGDNHDSQLLLKVFPPCNTSHLQTYPIHMDGVEAAGTLSNLSHMRRRVILSVGQFRPEKDHALQLCALSKLLRKDNNKYSDVRLVMLGSSRNAGDEAIIRDLRELAKGLHVADNVDFVINAPFDKLESYLREASVGIHTMWNEHFGISVVEMMAAGLVVVAHDSGGPSMDIVTSFEDQQTGYLASTPSEYANALAEALDTMSDPDSSTSSLAMRLAARASADRFSDEKFSASIVSHFQSFLKLQAQ